MGWAEDPAKAQAVAAANAEAQEAIARRLDAHANAALSPFERKLLGVIEDLRDAVTSPGAGPVLATLDADTDRDTMNAILTALPHGSIITGPNGPILSVVPLRGAGPAVTDDGLACLADASPSDLGLAVDAAARALRDLDPWLLHAHTVTFEQLAEIALAAALHAALKPSGAGVRGDGRASAPTSTTSPGQDGAQEDGAAGGADAAMPPAEHPAP